MELTMELNLALNLQQPSRISLSVGTRGVSHRSSFRVQFNKESDLVLHFKQWLQHSKVET